MGPNDIQLARVWTRNTGGTVSDVTFPSDTAFQVVVDAEAGATAATSGMPWEITICVRDLHDNSPIVLTDSLSGTLGAAPWNNPELAAVFTIPAQPPARRGHVLEVLAQLSVRPVDPDVSFARSPLFCIQRP